MENAIPFRLNALVNNYLPHQEQSLKYGIPLDSQHGYSLYTTVNV